MEILSVGKLLEDRFGLLEFGTQGRTRTGTPVRAGDFESPASTIPPLGPIDFIGLYNSLSSKYPVLC